MTNNTVTHISLTVQGLGVKTVYVITSSQEGLENTAGGQI